MPIPNLQRVGFSDVSFNHKAARYVQRGRFISPTTVRAIVDADIAARSERMQRIGQRLADGEINDAEFGILMKPEIRAVHMVNVAAARGGFHNMGADGFGQVGGLLPFHYKRLQAFTADIRNGRYGEPPDANQIADRVAMYAQAGRGTFAYAKDGQMRDAGFQSKRNKLDPASKHCSGERSCLAMTALGKVAIDDPRYILEGQRICATACACETEYIKAA